jgi:putative serine protease PepD
MLIKHPSRRFLVPLLAAIVVVAAIVAAISLATNSTASSSSSNPATGAAQPAGAALQGTFVGLVQSVSPSVVQIQDQQGLGSGIVLDTAGDIVTNNHVVTGASTLTVTTSTGQRYPATLVGASAPNDLAVVKVSGAHLKPATFADSSKVQVGDIAVAIGNPLGLRSSVTEGIVSAFRQAVPEDGGKVTLPSVIQTSAAINPGNSGGGLMDIQGQVIGIPTLAATDPQLGGGSAPGIGFAIPSNTVKSIAGQVLAHATPSLTSAQAAATTR